MPELRADLFLAISMTEMCLLTLSFFKRFIMLVPTWPWFEKKLVLIKKNKLVKILYDSE